MDRKLTTALLMFVLSIAAFPGLAWAADGGASLNTILAGIGVGWVLSAGALFYNPRVGAIVAGLMGLGVSLYLGAQHAQTGDMACTVSETFDCGAIVRSEYSAIAGVPIAFFGSGFYAAAVALGIMGMVNGPQTRNGGRWLLAGGAFAVLYSIFLAWVSHTLGKWCLFCISLYGVNLLLLIAGYLWNRSVADTPATEEDNSLQTMLSAGAVVFVGALVVYNQATPEKPSLPTGDNIENIDPKELARLFEAPAGAMTLDGSEPLLGEEKALYTIVEFADFECPYCGLVAPELKELVANNKDVRLFYKHYPISSLCNENVGREGHVYACGAARASECARQQQRFWDLNRLMYKNQRNLTEPDLRFLAKQINLDIDAFAACLDNPITETAVRADVAHATQLGVTGTPSLYLKGVQGDEWIRVRGGPEEVLVLIEAHRKGVKLPPTPAAQAM